MPRILLQVFVFVCALNAAAEVTFHDSRTWRRARLVPGGQQVWAFQTSYQNVEERFGNNGSVQPLGRGYERAVTWGQILGVAGAARAELQDYMNSRGVREADVAATAAYDLEREQIGLSVDWTYGITRRWMIGFQIPLIHRTTRVNPQVSLTPVLAGGVSAMSLTDSDVRDRVQTMAERELVRGGFDGIPGETTSWHWGDVSLLSQFYAYDGDRWDWSIQQLVRFPSSRNPSVADYFRPSSDDGQVDLGITSLTDVYIRRWTLGFRLGYVMQLRDSAKMRVSDSLDGVEPDISRDLGDWIWTAADVTYRVNRSLSLDAEYAYLNKARDHYDSATPLYPATETAQEIHQTRVGMTYVLGDTSRRRGVEEKWVASVGYTYPWAGQNSPDASRTSLELISYF